MAGEIPLGIGIYVTSHGLEAFQRIQQEMRRLGGLTRGMIQSELMNVTTQMGNFMNETISSPAIIAAQAALASFGSTMVELTREFSRVPSTRGLDELATSLSRVRQVFLESLAASQGYSGNLDDLERILAEATPQEREFLAVLERQIGVLEGLSAAERQSAAARARFARSTDEAVIASQRAKEMARAEREAMLKQAQFERRTSQEHFRHVINNIRQEERVQQELQRFERRAANEHHRRVREQARQEQRVQQELLRFERRTSEEHFRRLQREAAQERRHAAEMARLKGIRAQFTAVRRIAPGVGPEQALIAKLGQSLSRAASKAGEASRPLQSALERMVQLSHAPRVAAGEVQNLALKFDGLRQEALRAIAAERGLSLETEGITRIKRVASTEERAYVNALQRTSRQLNKMAADMRQAARASMEMKRTNQESMVSFHNLSAATSGLMLGMNVMRGDIQSTLFSLIFMQFNVKTAAQRMLMFSGILAGVAATAMQVFLGWVDRLGDSLERLGRNLLYSTRSWRATAAMMSVASELARVTGGDVEDVAAAMQVLADRNITQMQTQEQNMRTIMAILELARARGISAAEAAGMFADAVGDIGSQGPNLAALRRQGVMLTDDMVRGMNRQQVAIVATEAILRRYGGTIKHWVSTTEGAMKQAERSIEQAPFVKHFMQGLSDFKRTFSLAWRALWERLSGKEVTPLPQPGELGFDEFFEYFKRQDRTLSLFVLGPRSRFLSGIPGYENLKRLIEEEENRSQIREGGGKKVLPSLLPVEESTKQIDRGIVPFRNSVSRFLRDGLRPLQNLRRRMQTLFRGGFSYSAVRSIITGFFAGISALTRGTVIDVAGWLEDNILIPIRRFINYHFPGLINEETGEIDIGNWWRGFRRRVEEIGTEIAAWIEQNILVPIRQFLNYHFPGLVNEETGAIDIGNWWGGFKRKVEEIGMEISRWLDEHIVRPVRNFLQVTFPGLFTPQGNFDPLGWGRNLIQNFADGITEKWNQLIGEGGILWTIVEWFRDHFGSHSPPRLGPLHFIRDWGENLMEEYAYGLRQGASAVMSAIDDIGSEVAHSLGSMAVTVPAASLPAPSMGGGLSLHVNVHVSDNTVVGSGGMHELAQVIGQDIVKEISGHVRVLTRMR